MKKPIVISATLLILFLGIIWYHQPQTAALPTDASFLSILSNNNNSGYALALEPNQIEFPRDLGPHPEYQTEWWYYTGNLETEDGRRFGYQLTFFRNALSPEPTAETGSAWRTNQAYLAHFTITDVQEKQFYPAERFSRGALELAGANSEPYHVWLDNWHAKEIAPGVVELFATTEEVTLQLNLTQTVPPVLHGDGGLSQKGSAPGNASYYYSLVQQKTTGTISIAETQYAVTGKSWKDHEYSTSALAPNAEGWDWFSLQFDNGYSLMFFQIRHADGSIEPYSTGSFISPAGTVTPISLADWRLTVLDWWESDSSNGRYPIAWQIDIPTLALSLQGTALIENQELSVSTVYWEGAVQFSGQFQETPVTAFGYVEMTGYIAR